MTDGVRDAMRSRARDFFDSPAFQRYYDRAHLAKWLWVTGQLIRCATLVGLPGGIAGLAATRRRVFDTDGLRARYRALIQESVVVEGFVVINHGRLDLDPHAAAPALIVAALDGTDAGDARARSAWERLVERVLMDASETAVDQAVAALVADDAYASCRKRWLPSEFAEGPVCLLDVWIDNNLLGSTLPGQAIRAPDVRHYFLVDPAPNGLSMLIPSAGCTLETHPAAEQRVGADGRRPA